MKQKNILLVLIFFLAVINIFGQAGGIISFDFVDQEIREVIFAFSAFAGISIIGDDTVSGRVSFQYIGTDFEQAFDSFLMTNRLFVDRTPEVWIVSRIRILVSEEEIIIDSYDALPSQLIDRLTRRTNTTILQDMLPTTRLTLHLQTETAEEAVELIMMPFPDFTVESGENFILISRAPADPFLGAFGAPGIINIREEYGIYEIDIERALLSEVLDQLFEIAGHEYISFIRSDQMVERARFSGLPFHETVALILEQSGGEFRVIGGFHYFFPRDQAAIITERRNEGKIWHRFVTRYLLANEALPLIQNRFSDLQVMTLPNNNAFLALVNDITSIDINQYIEIIDVPQSSQPLRLRYIRTQDLFRSLPPTVRRDDLVDTGDGNTFFFTGSADRKAMFIRELEIIDRPLPRIRYDLFIIQVQDGVNLNWSASAELNTIRPGGRTMLTGQLGNLFNLNFDVITIFGYHFAARLNASITNNQARVFADTTLFGLSGQDIRFQNTSTFRYRDSNIDPETGRPIFSGVTREIISGLILEVSGWVSGDGMITTTVTASVSSRGGDASNGVAPPPTTEKVLTTHVRARSGEPIILSGLRQNDSTTIDQRVPFISRIPVLGWFFRSLNNTNENTQMIIYLVPHVDIANDEFSISGLRTASIFNRFVEPFAGDR